MNKSMHVCINCVYCSLKHKDTGICEHPNLNEMPYFITIVDRRIPDIYQHNNCKLIEFLEY